MCDSEINAAWTKLVDDIGKLERGEPPPTPIECVNLEDIEVSNLIRGLRNEEIRKELFEYYPISILKLESRAYWYYLPSYLIRALQGWDRSRAMHQAILERGAVYVDVSDYLDDHRYFLRNDIMVMIEVCSTFGRFNCSSEEIGRTIDSLARLLK